MIYMEPISIASVLSSSGEDVPVAHCVDNHPPTAVSCEVACPADCVVGPWSSWLPCSHSCATKTAEGRQSRTRTVLAIPGNGIATSPQFLSNPFPPEKYKTLGGRGTHFYMPFSHSQLHLISTLQLYCSWKIKQDI